jgi:cobalt-zinc-cadmium efflux system membrane fusion protein
MKCFLAALSICAGLLACGQKPKAAVGPPDDEQWIPREAFERGEASSVKIERREVQSPIVAAGRIAFDDLRVAHVFSPVSGRVTRLLVRLGDRVRKGTPLAVLVSPDVGSAVSDERKARADLTAAEHDFDRQKKLFDAKAASGRDLETAQATYHKAKTEHERAQKRLRLLRAGHVDAVTQEYFLPSPIEGRVIAMAANPGVEVQGQYSGGSPSGELFTVGAIDSVWLFADVPESELKDVAISAPVDTRVLAYPKQVFRGTIDWVSPTLDPALRTARVRCSLPNPDGALKPEMFATAAIERAPRAGLALPSAAIVTINDQPFVYVAAGQAPGGKLIYRRRRIAISDHARSGRASGGEQVLLEQQAPWVLVESGLADGEQVLVEQRSGPEPAGEEVVLAGAQWRSGTVALAPAEIRELADFVTVSARLAFDDRRVTHVFSPVHGRITRVIASPGQRVRKGDPLAALLSQDLGSAFADELKAKADLQAAAREVERQRELVALQASARRELEAAEDNFLRAKAELQRASQKARLLHAQGLDDVTQEFLLRSPIDGEVIARNANPGLEVQGQYSAGGNMVELFTIGRMDELWAFGEVYEVDLPSIRLGAEMKLELPAQPGRVFRGRVDWISDVLDPVQRTVKVRCVLDNRERLLRPEMYGVATIAAPGRRAVTVPREALLRLGDETDVFVVDARVKSGEVARGERMAFRRRRVVADEQVPGERVAVLAGLQAGEQVAARGAIFLVGN